MAIAREILSIPLASILLCIIAYEIGTWINKKTGISVLHPLPVAIAIVIFVLAVCKVDYQTFNAGGQFVTMFVGPATVCLAVPLYKNVQKLKRNLIPILVATTVGSITSIVLAVLMGKALGLNEQLIVSLVPRSVTVPIGIEISKQMGGFVSISLLTIAVTGTLGAMLSVPLAKLFRLKDGVAEGLAIGTSTHAVGTAKAMEMGELQGAMSGLAMGIAAVVTVFLVQFVYLII